MVSLAYAQTAMEGGGPGPIVQLLPLILIFVVFYFLLLRPQQQKARAQREMIANLKRNDEVMTAGGLYGKVIELNDKIVTLEVAPNVRVRIDRPHISALLSGGKLAKGSGPDKIEGKDK